MIRLATAKIPHQLALHEPVRQPCATVDVASPPHLWTLTGPAHLALTERPSGRHHAAVTFAPLPAEASPPFIRFWASRAERRRPKDACACAQLEHFISCESVHLTSARRDSRIHTSIWPDGLRRAGQDNFPAHDAYLLSSCSRIEPLSLLKDVSEANPRPPRIGDTLSLSQA